MDDLAFVNLVKARLGWGMSEFEYKVIAAPEKGLKVKGVKSPADRFALALTEQMNEMAAEGWEYIRTDTLPSIERSGLTSTQTVYRNVMVFRRSVTDQNHEITLEEDDAPETAILEEWSEPSAAEPDLQTAQIDEGMDAAAPEDEPKA